MCVGCLTLHYCLNDFIWRYNLLFSLLLINRAFENRVLEKTFGPKREEKTTQEGALCTLLLVRIIRMIKSRKV